MENVIRDRAITELFRVTNFAVYENANVNWHRNVNVTLDGRGKRGTVKT